VIRNLFVKSSWIFLSLYFLFIDIKNFENIDLYVLFMLLNNCTKSFFKGLLIYYRIFSAHTLLSTTSYVNDHRGILIKMLSFVLILI
jgi:hypothetical protein